jgi:hypothetical protein
MMRMIIRMMIEGLRVDLRDDEVIIMEALMLLILINTTEMAKMRKKTKKTIL